MIRLNINENLLEGTVVTFGGQSYPKNGWSVCLAGGPGSGKGFSSEQFFLLDFKRFDVDELKKQFIKSIKRDGSALRQKASKDDYDLSNPADTGEVHNIVKTNKWMDKKQSQFFDNTLDELPNVLFDVTGDDPNKLKKYASMTREMGYKTALVWVVTNREEAMVRNAVRDRSVGDAIFHSKHNTINTNLYKFIKGEAGKYFDECWIVFGSHDHVGGTEAELKWLNDHRTIQLKKQGNQFVPTNKEAGRIFTILGGEEPNPANPQKYVDFATVKQRVTDKGVTSKTSQTTDWGDVKFTREHLSRKRRKR